MNMNETKRRLALAYDGDAVRRAMSRGSRLEAGGAGVVLQAAEGGMAFQRLLLRK